MAEKIKTKFSNLDNLLLFIFGASLVVPTVVQSYGFDIRFVWMPTICYIVWNVVVGYVRPNFVVVESKEQSTIERIRGWSYLVALAITLPLNFLLLQYLPKTAPYLSVGFLFVAIIVIILKVSFRLFPNFFFKQELSCMNAIELNHIRKMLLETGSASIWISFALLFINGEIVNPLLFPYSSIGFIVVATVFLYLAFKDNKKSNAIAIRLSESLVKNCWYKKYSAKHRRKTKIKQITAR